MRIRSEKRIVRVYVGLESPSAVLWYGAREAERFTRARETKRKGLTLTWPGKRVREGSYQWNGRGGDPHFDQSEVFGEWEGLQERRLRRCSKQCDLEESTMGFLASKLYSNSCSCEGRTPRSIRQVPWSSMRQRTRRSYMRQSTNQKTVQYSQASNHNP